MELGNSVGEIEAVLSDGVETEPKGISTEVENGTSSDGVETKPKGTTEVENGISRLSELN